MVKTHFHEIVCNWKFSLVFLKKIYVRHSAAFGLFGIFTRGAINVFTCFFPYMLSDWFFQCIPLRSNETVMGFQMALKKLFGDNGFSRKSPTNLLITRWGSSICVSFIIKYFAWSTSTNYSSNPYTAQHWKNSIQKTFLNKWRPKKIVESESCIMNVVLKGKISAYILFFLAE